MEMHHVLHTVHLRLLTRALLYLLFILQCSRSCGSGTQKRELSCGEADSHGGYVPSAALTYRSADPPHGGSCLEAVLCLPFRRYVEFPVRRCRNLAKPTVDLQQGCNRGPCPEFPRTIPGRITTTALVSGWYSSPWHQVQYYPDVHVYVGVQHAYT